MYIISVLGENYNRGDIMKNRRIKRIMIPIIYGASVLAFVVSMYVAGIIANKYLFGKSDDLQYVDGEITEELDKDIPVVSTPSVIVRPYLNNDVKLAKSFYDYKADSESQERSIILFEDTYMQNSGVDYTNNEVFDIISVLDGSVISVKDDNILGIVVEVRHSNDLISVYQSLSEVSVKEGDELIQGQIIGKSGTSNINKDLGNHLHFELYYKGTIVNPEEYYNKDVSEL